MNFEFPVVENKYTHKGRPRLITEPTYEVEYNWLEWLIKEQYGHELCFVAAWEQGNNTSNDVTVEAIGPDKWDADELNEFKEQGKYQYGTPRLVMNELCCNGKLAPGRYIVEISW